MKVKLLGSVFLLSFSAIVSLKFFNSLTPDWDFAIAVILLGIFLPGISGLGLLIACAKEKYQKKHRKLAIQEQNLNADIIRLAARKGGKLTIFEVMAEFNLNAEVAEHALNGLTLKQLAKRKVNAEGVFIYQINNAGGLPNRFAPKRFLQEGLA